MKKLILFLGLCFIFNGCDDSGDSGKSNVEIPKTVAYRACLDAASINFTKDDLKKKFSICFDNGGIYYAKAKTILDKAGLKYDAENPDFCFDIEEYSFNRYDLTHRIYSVPPKDDNGCYYYDGYDGIRCYRTASAFYHASYDYDIVDNSTLENKDINMEFSEVYEITMSTKCDNHGAFNWPKRAKADFVEIIADRIKNNPDESVSTIVSIYE